MYILSILMLAFSVNLNAYAHVNITTLRVLIHKGPEANVLRTLIKKYELLYNRKLINEKRYDKYKLHIETSTKDEYVYQDALKEIVNLQNPPDLFEVDAPHVAYMVFKKHLRPLEPYLLDLLDDFYAALIAQGTVNGVLYTLPTYNSSVALYYNKDIITEQIVKKAHVNGFPTSIDNSWTYSELRNVLLKCLELKKAHYGLLLDMDLSRSTADELLTFLYLPIIYSKIDRIMNTETYKFSGYLNHSQAAEALAAFQKDFLFDPDHPNLVLIEPESIERDYVHRRKDQKDPKKHEEYIDCTMSCCGENEDYLKAFKNGEVAMLWHGHWQYETLHACLKDKLGIIPLPYFKCFKRVSPFGSYSWAMHIRTKHPDLVSDLIRYLTSGEVQKKVIEGFTKSDIKKAIKEKYLDLDQDDGKKLLENIDKANSDEIVLKSGGALPTRYSAGDLLGIYRIPDKSDLPNIQANPRLVFIRQSENTAVARPKTPAYSVFTHKFANMLRNLTRHAPDSTMPISDAQDYLDDIALETDLYMKQLILEEQLK